MQNLKPLVYKNYVIEPLVYMQSTPKRSKRLQVNRYHASVRIVQLDTNEVQTAALPQDFEFFGDARRAAEAVAREMIDRPADLDTGITAQAALAATITATMFAEVAPSVEAGHVAN